MTASGQGEQPHASPGRGRCSAAKSGGMRRSVSDSGHRQDYNMAGTHLSSPQRKRRADSATSQMHSSPHRPDFNDVPGSVGFSPHGMSSLSSQGSDSPRQQRYPSGAGSASSRGYNPDADIDDILNHPGYSKSINHPDSSASANSAAGNDGGGGSGGYPIPAPRRTASWSEPQQGGNFDLGLDGAHRAGRERTRRRTTSMARAEEMAANAAAEEEEEEKEPWYVEARSRSPSQYCTHGLVRSISSTCLLHVLPPFLSPFFFFFFFFFCCCCFGIARMFTFCILLFLFAKVHVLCQPIGHQHVHGGDWRHVCRGNNGDG